MVIDRDLVGVLISGICLVHCLIGPVLLLLGVASLGHIHTDEQQFHFLLLIPILLVAAWSIPSGLKKHHKTTPAIIAVVGIVFLVVGLLVIEWSLICSIIGSLCLLVAHLLNRSITSKTDPKCMIE